MRKIILALASLAILFAPHSALAQEREEAADCIHGIGDDTSGGKCISAGDLLGMLDLSVPENPLFTLMNSTPDTVIRPKVGDRLSISMLPQIANAFGQDEYALGFEINPGLMMMPENFTYAEFMGEAIAWNGGDQRERQLRDASFWSRFTIAGAATRTAGDDATVSRYGLGISYNHDTGSPLWAHAQGLYGDCITRLIPTNLSTARAQAWSRAARIVAARELGIPNDEAHRDALQADAEAHEAERSEEVGALRDTLLNEDPQFADYRRDVGIGVEQCIEEAAPWNRRVYGAGLALYYSETEGDNVALPESETGFGFWATYATPLGESDRRNQVIASVRYVDNGIRTRTEAGNEVTEAYDSWTVGARYVRSFAEGDNSRRAFRGFVEAAYTQEEFGGVDDEFSQAGIGFEVQLRDNIFFQAMVGDTFGSDIERGSYLTGQIKWSFSEGAAR